MCEILFSRNLETFIFQERLTAREAMDHPYFAPVVERARQSQAESAGEHREEAHSIAT